MSISSIVLVLRSSYLRKRFLLYVLHATMLREACFASMPLWQRIRLVVVTSSGLLRHHGMIGRVGRFWYGSFDLHNCGSRSLQKQKKGPNKTLGTTLNELMVAYQHPVK